MEASQLCLGGSWGFLKGFSKGFRFCLSRRDDASLMVKGLEREFIGFCKGFFGFYNERFVGYFLHGLFS